MSPVVRSVALPLLWVVVLAGAVGGGAYYLHHQPVSTDYDPPPDAAVPFDHYESSFSLADGNGSTHFVVDRTVTPERTLLRVDLRQQDGHTRARRVRDGPFDYVVRRSPTTERFRAQFDHDSTRWVAADNETRTVYALAWDSAGSGWLTGDYFADRFAFRKTGETTYHGVPAETYAVKSWRLPRDVDTWKGAGRLVVSVETGAILRFSATTVQSGQTYRVDYEVVPIEPPAEPVGADVVRAVRRNVTVNTSIYPDRYGLDPAAYSFQSGDVVGVEFEVDEAAPALPAGARVVATDRNGTTYATTLVEPFRPRRNEDSPVLDLAFVVEDGSLVRTDVGGEADPLRPAPALQRLVVRDPDRGWTYVNATVRGRGVDGVSVESRWTLDDRRYVRLTPRPATGVGVLRYRLFTVNGTLTAEGAIHADSPVALAWIDHDTVWALSERPDDELIAAPNGTRTVRYRLEVTGPRGRLTETTVRLDRPVRDATDGRDATDS